MINNQCFVETNNQLTIINKSLDGVELTYSGHIPEIDDFVLKMNSCRWCKRDGARNLFSTYEALPLLYSFFNKHGYYSKELENIINNVHKVKQQLQYEKINYTYNTKIQRCTDKVDRLRITISPVPPFSDMKKISELCNFWSWQDDTIEIPIYHIVYFFKKISELQIGKFIMEENPYYNIVAKWGKQYHLMDIKNHTFKFKPYDFQIRDIKTLFEKKRLLNANEMGCGKTFEQIIVGESIPMPKLVICPATLRLNWEKEIKMVNPNADVRIIYSNNHHVEFSNEWNIIAYTSLKQHGQVLEDAMFQVIMVDEAHTCKAVNNMGEPDSQRAVNVLRLCATAEYVYPITGTPKPNRNKDVYNLLRMIRVPETQIPFGFIEFGKKYCNGRKYQYGWNFSGNSNDQQLFVTLKSNEIRHLKKEVLPHLKKRRQFIPIECDLDAYKRELDEYQKAKKMKITLEAQLGKIMSSRLVLSKKKAETAIELIESFLDANEKVVFVAAFTESLNIIKEKFGNKCVVIKGGMTDEQKQTSIDEFQNGNAMICAMNIKAGGVGITLTAAHNMIMNDYDWVPADIIQAEDRICRGDQKELCNVYYLYAYGAEIDEDFINMLTSKFDTIDKMVDNGEGDNFNMQEEVLKILNLYL